MRLPIFPESVVLIGIIMKDVFVTAQTFQTACANSGKCFHMNGDKTALYNDKKAACVSAGYDGLATIDDADENTVFQTLAQNWSNSYCGGHVRLALKNDVEGRDHAAWYWDLDPPVYLEASGKYQNWNPHQRDNGPTSPYILGGMYAWTDGDWFDHGNGDWNICYGCMTSANAGGGGDPHFNGFGNIFFSWQGHCDSVLLKIPKLNGIEIDVEVHIRTRQVRNWSAIDTIALKVGKDILEIESNKGQLVRNGIEVNSIQTNSLNVTKSFSLSKRKIVVYKFVFDNDKMLEVEVNTRSKMVYTSFSGNFPQGTVGILGSPRSPGLYSRDGNLVTDKDINIFMESWQVCDSDPQLFQERRDPQYPAKCLYRTPGAKLNTHTRHLKQIQEVTMKEAKSACDVHRHRAMRDFCIEDVIATGDFDSAKDTFYG